MKKYLKIFLGIIIFIMSFFIIINITDTTKEKKYIPKIQNNDNKSITEKLKQKYNNNDVIGTIAITGTDINEVIMQTTNNTYYLNHDNYGNKDKYGSVFMDYRCNINSQKLLIFGHNDYKDKTPFSNLENYYNESYYKENQYIEVNIDDKNFKYQIFSVYVETKDFTYMNLNIDETKYSKDLIKYKNKSLYNTNVDVSPADKILILQTCSNLKKYQKYKDKYLLIIAKKIV